MKIYKDIDNPGQWVCEWTDRSGHYFCATGIGIIGAIGRLEAIDRMFEKLQWAEIGNWN